MDFHGIHLPDKNEPTVPGKKINEGRYANVYEWGDDKVIKLFKSSYPVEKITTEYYNSLAVKALPFKKSIALELKKTEFGYGIVFKKLEGESLSEYIYRTKDFKGAAEYMAELQKSINSCAYEVDKTEVIETAHQQLRRKMMESDKAESNATREMIRFLGTMKEGNSLCHGNLCPENIILSENGPAALSASGYCIGMPVYDVARTFFLIAYTPLPGEEQDKCICSGCKGITNIEERKEFGRYYLNFMGKTATEIGGYLSMIIAGM